MPANSAEKTAKSSFTPITVGQLTLTVSGEHITMVACHSLSPATFPLTIREAHELSQALYQAETAARAHLLAQRKADAKKMAAAARAALVPATASSLTVSDRQVQPGDVITYVSPGGAQLGRQILVVALDHESAFVVDLNSDALLPYPHDITELARRGSYGWQWRYEYRADGGPVACEKTEVLHV